MTIFRNGRSIRAALPQGLHSFSPELIDKAIDGTAEQVSRIGLTFVGTAAFCLLSLWTPDSALLSSSEKLNVPGAGPVSFFGFMFLGPAVLIVLRIYLQIYVEHGNRLDRIARRALMTRAPTLLPLQNLLIQGFSGIAFYLLLPFTLLLFARKAFVFPDWGSGLLCLAAVVIVNHAMLPLRWISWRSRVSITMVATILAAGTAFWFGSSQRPFDLSHANLQGSFSGRQDLTGAKLEYANLSRADLYFAKLCEADLEHAILNDARLDDAFMNRVYLNDAILNGAQLKRADLRGAFLDNAKLRDADLEGAKLDNADLSNADLSSARNLTQPQLDKACGKPAALPPGLKVVAICPPRKSLPPESVLSLFTGGLKWARYSCGAKETDLK